VNTCFGDSFIEPSFAFAHFLMCCFSSIFPSYIFSSLTNDTHILTPTHVVPFVLDHFVFQLIFVGVGRLASKVLILGPF
jgi:predicted permease